MEGSEFGTDRESEGAKGGGRLGLELRDSRRDRALAEDRTDAASDLSVAPGRVAREVEGLSLFVEAEILLRIDPRIDLVEPWVSDFAIGKVFPSALSEVVEELGGALPFSLDLLEGC